MHSLLNPIIEFAKENNVTRWGVHKTLNHFTLISHSARVVNIVTQMVNYYIRNNYEYLSYIQSDIDLMQDGENINQVENNIKYITNIQSDIMAYALYHDFGEVYLNDTPSNVKKRFPELDKQIKDAEDILTQDIYEYKHNDNNSLFLIKSIIKMADWIDCAYECIQELKLGNHNDCFIDYLKSCESRFDKYEAINKYIHYLDQSNKENIINIAKSFNEYSVRIINIMIKSSGLDELINPNHNKNQSIIEAVRSKLGI